MNHGEFDLEIDGIGIPTGIFRDLGPIGKVA